MGYYTRHYIKAFDLNPGHGGPALDETFFNSLCFDRTSPDDNYWELAHSDKRNMYYFAQDECKWYDHQEELEAASTKHRDIVFILDGVGSDAGDIWREFYVNGKMIHQWRPNTTPPEWEDVWKTGCNGGL